ncbi:IS701 family transposase [Persicimonas caeni]
MTSTILPLIAQFRSAFSAPSFANFQFLMLAWLMNPARGWISNCLRAIFHMPQLYPTDRGKAKHFSCFYRLFSRAKWSTDELGHLMLGLFEPWLGESVTILIDDTLCRRSGPMVLGAGFHYDPLQVSYEQGRHRVRFSFGLNFVVLAVWVPCPFVHARGVAIPVLFRLYRSKKTCPEGKWKRRTELAVEMLEVLRSWWPTRPLELCVDDEYACKRVGAVLDQNIILTAPMRFDAALYQHKRPEHTGRGRRPIWGKRLETPKELAQDASVPWQHMELVVYGRTVTLMVKTYQARWKSMGKERVLTILVTRDPTGTYDDRCFFRTEADAEVQDFFTTICRRWTLEMTFRDAKQLLHLEDIQSGFIHRGKPAKTHRRKRPGPQAPVDADPRASRRTGPFVMLAYGFVVRWYLAHGQPARDLKWAKFLAPWWRHKTTISFGDMLQAFRRQMEHEQLWTNPPEHGFDENYLQSLGFERPNQQKLFTMAA